MKQESHGKLRLARLSGSDWLKGCNHLGESVISLSEIRLRELHLDARGEVFHA